MRKTKWKLSRRITSAAQKAECKALAVSVLRRGELALG